MKLTIELKDELAYRWECDRLEEFFQKAMHLFYREHMEYPSDESFTEEEIGLAEALMEAFGEAEEAEE